MLTEEQIRDATILIVDDEPANIQLLSEILRTDGYARLHSTTDPLEALDLYRELQPDLVLLDIRMPQLDGLEVLRRLQRIELGHYTPVLVLTGKTDLATRLQALEGGARDFVAKPFERHEILARIHHQVEIRLLHKVILQQNEELTAAMDVRTLELHAMRLEVLQRLGRAAEYRDNETGMHIERMSRIAGLVSAELGLSPQLGDLILNASPMHDIGKIGVPDSVLLKPGKLDEDEWKVMRTHTTIGGGILSGGATPLLQLAESIALTHHEWWDGSGYPNGLRGETIPIEGRICAVSDVLDALTSERPYKRAWPLDEAIDCIRGESGTHFDPAVVEALTAVLPSVGEILTTYQG
jgi:putative two-component system response regulator